jgi:hypothetical protein
MPAQKWKVTKFEELDNRGGVLEILFPGAYIRIKVVTM